MTIRSRVVIGNNDQTKKNVVVPEKNCQRKLIRRRENGSTKTAQEKINPTDKVDKINKRRKVN